MTILLNKPLAPCLKTLTGYLEQINERGLYTNFGPLHQELTNRLEEYLGVKNLLLVANGTLALHVTYRALNIKRAICTPFSYSATASSLAWEKIPLQFVDIDSQTLNLNPSLVAKTLKNFNDIDSVVATHVYGNACDVNAFDKLHYEHNVKIIYDGAHAFNVKYGKESVLNFGDASTLSFHATKIFHTIEGGAIVFKEKDNFNRAKNIINFGQDSSGALGQQGINAKLNEYQCAVGLTLLDSIENVVHHRIDLFNLYKKYLEDYVQIPIWDKDSSINGAYFPIILKSEKSRRQIKQALDKEGIPSREYFSPSLNTIYKSEDICPISESIASRVLCLPLHFSMSKDNITLIAKSLKKAMQ